jgi:hypothetical protein
VEETSNCGRYKVLWVVKELWEQQKIMGDYDVFWENSVLWEK